MSYDLCTLVFGREVFQQVLVLDSGYVLPRPRAAEPFGYSRRRREMRLKSVCWRTLARISNEQTRMCLAPGVVTCEHAFHRIFREATATIAVRLCSEPSVCLVPGLVFTVVRICRGRR